MALNFIMLLFVILLTNILADKKIKINQIFDDNIMKQIHKWFFTERKDI